MWMQDVLAGVLPTTSRIYREKERQEGERLIYYEGYPHTITKARKSHTLELEGQKAGGKIQSGSEGLRISNTNIHGQKKISVSAQTESEFTLPPPVCSVGLLWGSPGDWRRPTHVGECYLLTPLTNSDANLSWKHPHGHIQNKCFTSYLSSQVST